MVNTDNNPINYKETKTEININNNPLKDVSIRDTVLIFANNMEQKLVENDYKRDWENCSKSFLKVKLLEEIAELFDSLKHSNQRKITAEAADVANIAMMIADNFGI